MSGSPAAASERGQPVVVLDDLVGDDTGRDVTRPADHLRDAERAFPVGVLLASERGGRAVGPRVGVRTVVGAVDDDGVVSDTQLVKRIEQLADIPVVVDHRVVVRRLPASGLTEALRLGVGPEVHVGEVHPQEERRGSLVLSLHEVDGCLGGLVVDGLHALLGQRPGVLDALLAGGAVPRIYSLVVVSRGP